MAQTKQQIADQLTALGVAFDPKAQKADLEALLPKPVEGGIEDTSSVQPTPNTDRQARWEAALASLEKNYPAAFAARKASGEFDKIPNSFE